MPDLKINRFPAREGFGLYEEGGELKLAYFDANGNIAGGYPFAALRDTGDGAILILATVHGGPIQAEADGKIVVDR